MSARRTASRTPTDVSNPQYYHKVVDCQWACPAHTNVPEYIRLIAQGRFTESYMLNRESNVFPGILGRTCDRPCEPACRRGRVDGKPVAICRLKRVAADNRDDITEFLPKAPHEKNGKRVALDRRRAGVAHRRERPHAARLRGRDLREARRTRRTDADQHSVVPAAGIRARRRGRLHPRHGRRHSVQLAGHEHAQHCSPSNWDAVFVGSGAPTGKNLDIPGRAEASANIHIGIEWLASAHFGHIEKIGERVLIIGVGNTAMDCCRTSRRLGGNGREGHRASLAAVLQGVAVGIRGC